LVFTDGVGVIDLVTEDDEWSGFELFHGEQGIELGLGLVETLVILRIDEEDDTTDFWEVVPPKSACLCVAPEIKRRELDVAY